MPAGVRASGGGVGGGLPEGRGRAGPARRQVLLAGVGAALTGALAGLPACGRRAPDPASGALIGTRPVDGATAARLDRTFDAAFAATGAAGMAAAARMGDAGWSRSRGVSDLATGAPFRPGDHLRIASITKSFCATAVLQLVDRGRLALEDPLERFVPGLPNGRRINVDLLLGMRSGLPDVSDDSGLMAAFDADPARRFTDDEIVGALARHPARFEPGAKVVYTDSNYILLGIIIEQVTGTPRGQFITADIIEPLGLSQTSYPTTGTVPAPHPTAYVPPVADPAQPTPFDNAARPPRVVNVVDPSLPGTAGAMISTLADLDRWGRELTEGSLLSAESQRRRLAGRRLDGVAVNLGYGYGVMTLNEFVGHNGAVFGYSSLVMRRPQTDTTIVVSCNESTNETTPATDVGFAVIGELFPDQVR